MDRHWLQTKGDLIRIIGWVIWVIIFSALLAAFVGYLMNDVIPKMVQKNTMPIKMAENVEIKEALKPHYPAPELQNLSNWINSPPLKIADLKGKVVLIDFWTHSCINCVRTLPYLKSWYDKYHDKGLVIIGVHTPEFEFEKDLDNVKRAVEAYQIHYPVALDNQYGTWTAFQNLYSPAHYLIDKAGNIVYEHSGEGRYDETEYNILALLGMKVIPSATLIANENSILTFEQSPETYFGYFRQDGYRGGQTLASDNIKQYSYPQTLLKNAWGLDGLWKVEGEKIISSGPKASLKMHFFAKKVYVVMGTEGNQTHSINVRLNGKDVQQNKMLVKSPGLFEVINQDELKGGIIELIADEPGLEIYAFTFG